MPLPDQSSSVPGRGSPLPTVFGCLFLLVLAAYGSALFGYREAADDVPLRFSLHLHGGEFSYAHEGIWRLIGIKLAALGLSISPGGYLAAILALHALNATLLFRLLRHFLVPATFALGLAAIFAVFPGFHQAVVWIAATNFLWSATCFLLTLWLCFVNPLGMQRIGLTAGLALVTSLVGNLCNEQFSFVYLALPACLAWLECGRWFPPLTRSLVLRGAAPVAGTLIYIVAFFLTSGLQASKAPAFNPRTTLSAWYYQYVNFLPFQAWVEPQWLRAYREDIPTMVGIGMLAALLAGGLLLRRGLARLPAGAGSPPPAPAPARAAIGLLALAMSAVHTAAGGYSLDSRKRYAFVIIVTLAAVLFRSRLAGRPLTHRVRPLFLGLVVFLALTTQLLTSMRSSFITARDEMAGLIERGAVPAGTWISGWDDGPTGIWRWLWSDVRMEFFYMHSPRTSVSPIVTDRSAAHHQAVYDWSGRQWTVSPLTP